MVTGTNYVSASFPIERMIKQEIEASPFLPIGRVGLCDVWATDASKLNFR